MKNVQEKLNVIYKRNPDKSKQKALQHCHFVAFTSKCEYPVCNRNTSHANIFDTILLQI